MRPEAAPVFPGVCRRRGHRLDAVAVYDVWCGPRDAAEGFQFRWEMGRLGISAVSASAPGWYLRHRCIPD